MRYSLTRHPLKEGPVCAESPPTIERKGMCGPSRRVRQILSDGRSEQMFSCCFQSLTCALLACDKMKGSVYITAIRVLFCLSTFWYPIEGGVCWERNNENGACTDSLMSNTTKEECCRQFPQASTAWSKDDLDSRTFFFARVVGVTCYSCKENCDGVDCGPRKTCVMRSGRPKCVCPPCRGKAKGRKDPVCGSDGRTYLNECRLRKEACRRSPSLELAHKGHCQSSCDGMTCPEGEFCLLDQNRSPHCVRCNIRCPGTPEDSRPVCGADGVSYNNLCDLRQRACRSGKAIPVAYDGKCEANATCARIHCERRKSCLTDPNTGFPRCVTCGDECTRGITTQLGGPICGTNNRTYHSWCHMMKDSCATGVVIETQFKGSCEEKVRPIPGRA